MKRSSHILDSFLLCLSLFAIGCGDGSNGPNTSNGIQTADSLMPAVGEWQLVQIDGTQIPSMQAANLNVQNSQTSLTNTECTGAVVASVGSDGHLELVSNSSTNCHIDFLRETLINRQKIIDALQAGATIELVDGKLVLKTSSTELIFQRETN